MSSSLGTRVSAPPTSPVPSRAVAGVCAPGHGRALRATAGLRVLPLLAVCAAGFSLTLPAQGRPDVAATTVILVRHGERADDGSPDPGLSQAGEARARALAEALAGSRPAGIVTTQYRRTRLTAAPTAVAHGLEPVIVATSGGTAVHVRAVADTVLARFSGRTVLVVGHSNTVGGIVAALGGPRLPDLCDTEFSTMLVLVLRPGAEPSLVRARYGAEDPPPGSACARP